MQLSAVPPSDGIAQEVTVLRVDRSTDGRQGTLHPSVNVTREDADWWWTPLKSSHSLLSSQVSLLCRNPSRTASYALAFEEFDAGGFSLSLLSSNGCLFSAALRLHRHHKYGLKVLHKFGASRSCLWEDEIDAVFGGREGRRPN